MKTTIEVQGYEIIINEGEEGLTVSAMKEGEVVEEFSLEVGEESQESEEGQGEDEGREGVKSFDDFGGEEEEDFGGEEGSEDLNDTIQGEEEESQEESQEEEEEEEENESLKTFESFINKKK